MKRTLLVITLFAVLIAIGACKKKEEQPVAKAPAAKQEATQAARRIVFGGGPAGGTFQVVANAIQTYKPVKEAKGFTVKAQSSAGSVENLRKVNTGKHDFSVVYSGHVYLGRNGKMKNDTKKYENVMAVAYLYGAPERWE
jgi:TRAP-type uncharacterized transport system substrate-binding protein